MNKAVKSEKEKLEIIQFIRYAKSVNAEYDWADKYSTKRVDCTCWSKAVVYASSAMNKALGLGKSDDLAPHIGTIVDALYDFGLSTETGEHIKEYFTMDKETKRKVHRMGFNMCTTSEMISREQSMEFVRTVKKFCTHKVGIKRQEYKNELLKAIKEGKEEWLSA